MGKHGVSKKIGANQYTNNILNRVHHFDEPKATRFKIADQIGVGTQVSVLKMRTLKDLDIGNKMTD